ncbi:unnamed protein product [Linum tenue]|uniref:Dirigent protein n=1 Tax=Linum tenue TaxID=586396 RepID=A0AAV0HSZ7_9ROSI|nr:unnamed protein product [Linum tenue]
MADNPLTLDPELNSTTVGRAQGLYGVASRTDATFMELFNFVFKADGEYRGSTVTVLGRNHILAAGIREMPVVGGTGVFGFARGKVEVDRRHKSLPVAFLLFGKQILENLIRPIGENPKEILCNLIPRIEESLKEIIGINLRNWLFVGPRSFLSFLPLLLAPDRNRLHITAAKPNVCLSLMFATSERKKELLRPQITGISSPSSTKPMITNSYPSSTAANSGSSHQKTTSEKAFLGSIVIADPYPPQVPGRRPTSSGICPKIRGWRATSCRSYDVRGATARGDELLLALPGWSCGGSSRWRRRGGGGRGRSLLATWRCGWSCGGETWWRRRGGGGEVEGGGEGLSGEGPRQTLTEALLELATREAALDPLPPDYDTDAEWGDYEGGCCDESHLAKEEPDWGWFRSNMVHPPCPRYEKR